MKIYLLGSHEDHEGTYVHGIFSSREKAIESFKFQSSPLDETDIEEYELDVHGEGEYLNTFYCRLEIHRETRAIINLSLGSEWRSKDVILIPRFSVIGHNFAIVVYGPTPEQAEAMARDSIKLIDPVWQYSEFRTGGVNEYLIPRREDIYKKWRNYSVHRDHNVAVNSYETWKKTGVADEFMVVNQ